MNSTFKKRLLKSLLSFDNQNAHMALPSSFNRGIPILLMQFLLSTVYKNKAFIVENIELQKTSTITEKHIQCIEFLFSNIFLSDNHIIVGDFEKDLLRRIVGNEYEEILEDILDLKIIIKEPFGIMKRISFFDFFTYDFKTNHYKYGLSSDMTFLYFNDYLLPIEVCKKSIWSIEDKYSSLIIRYVLTMPYGSNNGIFLETIIERMGYELSGLETVKIGRLLGAKKELEDVGIHFDILNKKFEYNKNKYPDFYCYKKDFKVKKTSKYIPGIKKPEPKVKTTADTLVYNENMHSISLKHGIEKSEEDELFLKFKNHYMSNGIKKVNWVPLWENYIINANKIKENNVLSSNTTLESMKSAFYMAQLVSDSIKDRLKAEGISISDVITKKKVVEGISYKTWPIPPGMGTGKETIFSWTNSNNQKLAITQFLNTIPEISNLIQKG